MGGVDSVLTLTHIIVRTVCFLLEVVSLIALDRLIATKSWAAHVLLGADRVRRSVVHCLWTLALPVQKIHLCTLPESYLWQILGRLRPVAARQRLPTLAFGWVSGLRVVGAVGAFLVVQRELVHLLLLRVS